VRAHRPETNQSFWLAALPAKSEVDHPDYPISTSRGCDRLGRLLAPVPSQQLKQAPGGMIRAAASHIDEPSQRIDVVQLRVAISEYIAAARSPLRPQGQADAPGTQGGLGPMETLQGDGWQDLSAHHISEQVTLHERPADWIACSSLQRRRPAYGRKSASSANVLCRISPRQIRSEDCAQLLHRVSNVSPPLVPWPCGSVRQTGTGYAAIRSPGG
jgi:hypothetical protein